MFKSSHLRILTGKNYPQMGQSSGVEQVKFVEDSL